MSVQHISRPGNGDRALCDGRRIVKILPGDPPVCKRCEVLVMLRDIIRERQARSAAMAAEITKHPQFPRE